MKSHEMPGGAQEKKETTPKERLVELLYQYNSGFKHTDVAGAIRIIDNEMKEDGSGFGVRAGIRNNTRHQVLEDAGKEEIPRYGKYSGVEGQRRGASPDEIAQSIIDMQMDHEEFKSLLLAFGKDRSESIIDMTNRLRHENEQALGTEYD